MVTCHSSNTFDKIKLLMELKEVQIFSFHYKPEPIVFNSKSYIHIWAGKNGTNTACELIGDDSGDNISAKNNYYSELTGIYWVWKNTSQDIVGSVHYRRFLTGKKEPLAYQAKRLLYYIIGLHKKRHGLIYTKNINLFKKAILTENEIIDLLKSYDLILPQQRKLKYTVRTHYKRYHNQSDLDLIQSIISEKCPQYLTSLEKVLAGKRLFANNMFIMRRADFDRCMQWLFDLLFEFERRIKLSDYQGYQERIMGFMAERLLNVWFAHEKLKIKELPVIYFKHFKFSN